MEDKQLEALIKEYKEKEQILIKEESVVDSNPDILTFDEPKSYYLALNEYIKCEDQIEKYLEDKYKLSQFQILMVLDGTSIDDILSGIIKEDKEKEIDLFVKNCQRRHKKVFIELGK